MTNCVLVLQTELDSKCGITKTNETRINDTFIARCTEQSTRYHSIS